MTTNDLAMRATGLCAAPAGCAFLLAIEEAGLTPEEAAQPVAAAFLAALAVEEVSPWFGGHGRVVAMALEQGSRLMPLARDVLAQPDAAAWFAPLDRQAQLWVTALGNAESIPVPDCPSRPLTNWERYAQKPDWGLWTSTELDATGTITSFLASVSWGVDDLSHYFQPPLAAYRLTIDSTARVYEIDGPNAWHHFCTRYPANGEDGRLVPDWPAVAEDWDGVHLSLGGLLTSEQVRTEDEHGWTQYWAWDAEQTVWLRDVFTEAVRLPELAELAEPPDWLQSPRALWIKPGPDTWPWLVSIPFDMEADVPRDDVFPDDGPPPRLR